MKSLLLCAALVCTSANAEIAGVVDDADGATIELHKEAGPCVGGALLAGYRPANAVKPTIGGCWKIVGKFVMVSFFDADRADIPISDVQLPKKI